MSSQDIRIPDHNLPRVVIIGGGFGGIQLAKSLGKKQYQVVLIDRHNYHTFQPLLYQVATAGLEPDAIAEPLRRVIEDKKNFYFRMAEVTKIHPDEKRITTSIGDLEYDKLVIASGAITNYFGNPFADKVFPLKQVPQALDLRSHMLQNLERAVLTTDEEERQSLMNFVVVGGGPTGVEVAGALGELKMHVMPKDYPELDFRKMEIYLVEANPRLLSSMSEKSSDKAYKYLKRFDVNIQINKLVKDYDGTQVKLSDGSVIPSATVIWGAGVMGNVPDGLHEEMIDRSRIVVDRYNQVLGLDDVYAIGDIALMRTDNFANGHPMLAPVAMQQAKLLAKNLVAESKKGTKKEFVYKNQGSMATIGRNKAVVDLPSLHFGGLLAWFVWMFVHLISIVGFRNRLVVLSNWIWNYFTYDRGTRLIIRPFVRPAKAQNRKEELPVK